MIKKWDIYYIDFNPTKGSEQSGQRPALVISNDAVNAHLPVCTVIPFSSYKKGARVYPTEIIVNKTLSGLKNDSILMLQQIRTIDIKRLISPAVASINDEGVRGEINFAIRQYFEV